MKRTFALILAIALIVALVPPAMAGEVGRATTKGFLLGIGSLLLFDALLNHARASQPAPVYAPPPAYAPPPVVYAPPPVVYAPPPAYAPPPPPVRWVPGYWEQRWVPQTTVRDVWVPGHYNRYGEWVEGHHERHVREGGYYTQVWVPGQWQPY
ncbi:MAG: hypothetical protein HYY19_00860 [Candidatus Rokubacteria bacterium]|nr:hypothetical protein [Candidatus Rokubacteria bacterium]